MTSILRGCPAMRRTHNAFRQVVHREFEFAQVKDDDCANRGRCASQSQLRFWGPLKECAILGCARTRRAPGANHVRRNSHDPIRRRLLFVGSFSSSERLFVYGSMTTVSRRRKPLTRMDQFGVAPALRRLSNLYFTEQQLPCIVTSSIHKQPVTQLYNNRQYHSHVSKGVCRNLKVAYCLLNIFSHPAHPAFVHFPITFTAITGALDGIYWLSKIPATAGVVNSVCE